VPTSLMASFVTSTSRWVLGHGRAVGAEQCLYLRRPDRCPARGGLDGARAAGSGPQRFARRRRPAHAYGRAAEFERTMDNLGAIVGPLLAALVGVRTVAAGQPGAGAARPRRRPSVHPPQPDGGLDTNWALHDVRVTLALRPDEPASEHPSRRVDRGTEAGRLVDRDELAAEQLPVRYTVRPPPGGKGRPGAHRAIVQGSMTKGLRAGLPTPSPGAPLKVDPGGLHVRSNRQTRPWLPY
jgi:hypothetical protein